MNDQVKDAIESACLGDDRRGGRIAVGRHISLERLTGLLLNVVRDLPEGMTVRELREELE